MEENFQFGALMPGFSPQQHVLQRPDWLVAMRNILQGGLPQDTKLFANDPRYMPSLDPGVRGEVTPVPLLDDPIFQLALSLAPLLLRRLGVAVYGFAQTF